MLGGPCVGCSPSPHMHSHICFACRVKAKGDECKRYVDHVAKLEEQYKWVVSERDSFGQGDFDFSKRDPKKVNQEYETAEKRLEELKGKVNHQVGGGGGKLPCPAVLCACLPACLPGSDPFVAIAKATCLPTHSAWPSWRRLRASAKGSRRSTPSWRTTRRASSR